MADTDADKRRALLLASFALLLEDVEEELDALCLSFLVGATGINAIAAQAQATLTDAHTQATYLGRRLAGVTAPLNANDQAFARSVMQEQSPYLQGLMDDLNRGRYTPETPDDAEGEADAPQQVPPALSNRLGLYAKRLRGTANEAWGLALPDETGFVWKLGDAENHCADCLERAKSSAETPYTKETLPGWPGDGSTQCFSSCDCEIETVAGEAGFPLSKD